MLLIVLTFEYIPKGKILLPFYGLAKPGPPWERGCKNSPHGKFHRFLFPFSSKFSDLNFISHVLYNVPVLLHVSHKVRLPHSPSQTKSTVKLKIVILTLHRDC